MPESDEALLLQRRARRRLIGAIALVVFVVIVLPIVFDKEPRPITHDLTIQIPSQDTPFKARAVPEAARPKPEEPAVNPGPLKLAEKPAEKVAEKPTAERPAKTSEAETRAVAQKPQPAPEAKPAVSHPEAKPEKSGSFVVPLGAYSNAANAKQMRERVAAAGFKTLQEPIKGPNGNRLRVRAGPFATREAAERAREKLKSLGLNPVGAVASREQP